MCKTRQNQMIDGSWRPNLTNWDPSYGHTLVPYPSGIKSVFNQQYYKSKIKYNQIESIH